MSAAALLAGSLVLAGPAPGAMAETGGVPADTAAPTTPQIERLGDPPQAGQPVTLRFSSSDADSGLQGFWYGIDEEVKREFADAPTPPGETGSAEVTFTVPLAGGRIFIYVWAVDNAGNHSNRANHSFFVPRGDEPPPPPPAPTARWPLAGGLLDVVGEHHLTLTGAEGVDYRWVEDVTCFPASALAVSGAGTAYAHTTDPVVTTDGSFSVAAWVVVESLTGHHTVLSQAGRIRPAMYLQATPDGRWRFDVPDRTLSRPGSTPAQTAPGTVVPDLWHHLTVVFDAEQQELRIYLNGELAATGTAGGRPWAADGPFYLGASGTALKPPTDPFHGVLGGAVAWPAALHPSYIRDLGTGGGLFPPCF